ncbi:hypothetical protein BLNAU_20140 [Blattamonas nauphoetae]|uniref:Uncharacterized protein n=1 Tax=Blattamonas nauphoetae TaxID=2049346 RepID=A0ABQ9X0U3_9EUKA|nr:hypothetical protein BLNAU_20140 [Blattamonas nauphoetae]
MFSHPSPGTPIETSVISNDFYEDFRQLVTDMKTMKERNQTLQNRVEQQNQLISQLHEMIAELTTRISNELRQQLQQTNSSISSNTSSLRTQINAVNTRVDQECLRKGINYKLKDWVFLSLVQILFVSTVLIDLPPFSYAMYVIVLFVLVHLSAACMHLLSL